VEGAREIDKDQVLIPFMQFLKCKPDITVISSTPQTTAIKVYIARFDQPSYASTCFIIKVFISSTLEYNIGYIEILNNGTMNNGSGFSQLVAAVVAVIIFIITLVIIVFCIFVIACMCLKKKSR
jgi:hypothetical protein